MWALSAAGCGSRSLLYAAAARGAELALSRSFTRSRQPLALLGALRCLGLTRSEADEPLAAEALRLKALEAGGIHQTKTTH
jgi:hypothetical protein